jgi:transcription-repair coupling factor (superfamily II helicase)
VLGIERKREATTIRFHQKARIEPERLARFVAGQHGAQFSPNGTLKFTLRAPNAEDVLQQLHELLLNLSGISRDGEEMRQGA